MKGLPKSPLFAPWMDQPEPNDDWDFGADPDLIAYMSDARKFLVMHVRLHCQVTGVRRRFLDFLVQNSVPSLLNPEWGQVDGYSNKRIAAAIGCAPNTLRKMLDVVEHHEEPPDAIRVFVDQYAGTHGAHRYGIAAVWPSDALEAQRRQEAIWAALREAELRRKLASHLERDATERFERTGVFS